MARLVQTTDFVGDIALPLDTQGAKQIKLCKFIDEYEPIFLRNALGDYIYTQISDWTDSGLAQKWKDIRDGVTYVVGEKAVRFEGIKRLVRKYIYSYYLEDEHTSVTLAGTKKERAANSSDADLGKSVRQWNKMALEIKEMWYMLENRVDDDGDLVYTEYDICQVNKRHFGPKNLMNI